MTALMLAARGGKHDAVKALVELGADLTLFNSVRNALVKIFNQSHVSSPLFI